MKETETGREREELINAPHFLSPLSLFSSLDDRVKVRISMGEEEGERE